MQRSLSFVSRKVLKRAVGRSVVHDHDDTDTFTTLQTFTTHSVGQSRRCSSRREQQPRWAGGSASGVCGAHHVGAAEINQRAPPPVREPPVVAGRNRLHNGDYQL